MSTQHTATGRTKPTCRIVPATPVTPELADLARLEIGAVCSLVGIRETRLRELIRAGRFPQPDYRDGPRCVRWSAGLVRRWLEETRQVQS